MAFLSEFGGKQETEYSQTENFANNYLYFFMDKVNECQMNHKTKYFDELEDEEGKIYCYFDSNSNYYQSQIGNYIDYIIVKRETGEIYTNIKSSNYQETIKEIKNQKIYWNLIDGKVETNLTYINEENIKYYYNYRHSEYDNYDIYSFFDTEKASKISNFMINKKIYDFMLQHKQIPGYTCALSLLLLIGIAIYLFWAIGYKKGKEGISLNSIDKIPYEIITIVCFTMLSFVLAILFNSYSSILHYALFIFYAITYLICYIICAIWGITTIKRIKAKTFLKSFLSYKIIRWCYHKIKKYVAEMKQKTSTSKKVFWYYWGFVAISIILGALVGNGIAVIALLLFWLWIFYKIKQYIRKQDEIKDALEKIYQGNNEVYIDDSELEGVLKEMAIYINDIARRIFKCD